MIKTIVKETGIVILLLIAVALILGILFYEYIPTSKIVPVKVQAYTLPEDVQKELKETMSSSEQNIVRTYYIDSTDLSLYESTNDYDKGKQNPFQDYTTIEENETNSVGSNNTTNVNTTKRNEVFFNSTGK